MQRTAGRFGVLTLILLGFGFAAAQAEVVTPLTLPQPVAQTDPFIEVASADRQASSALTTVVEATTPSGLTNSAAMMSSEAVRFQYWRPATPAEARTVVVRDGQSLWDIASAWGVSVQTIATANDLTNVDRVTPGQRLLIPATTDPGAPAKLAKAAAAKAAAVKAVASKPAVAQPKARVAASNVPPKAPTQARRSGAKSLTVTLGEGQTLWSLARAHGVSVGAIVEANGLRDANRVRAGSRLLIPGRSAVSRPSRVAAARGSAERAGEAFTKAASTTAIRIARGFLWPARGQLTSRFGWRRVRHHDGIDIAAPYGSPIYAARPVRVIFAGWYYAYGRAVIVDHGDGVQTLYGHASQLLVRTGQTVGQGELIARVGASGRATGPHVHFEVRVNGKAVNPMRYMD